MLLDPIEAAVDLIEAAVEPVEAAVDLVEPRGGLKTQGVDRGPVGAGREP
ncbi:MAG: hypothetical protein ABW212_14590 [Pseudonocardia sediminis]